MRLGAELQARLSLLLRLLGRLADAAGLERLRQAAVRAYRRLEPRERLLVRMAGLLLAALCAYVFVYQPLQDLIDGSGQAVAARKAELLEVEAMARTVKSLDRQLKAANRRIRASGASFSLPALVERAASSSVGHERIASITPSNRSLSGALIQYSVTLKLTRVSLVQVVDLLYALNRLSLPLAFPSLHMAARADDPYAYDVDLTCSAVASKG